MFKKLLRSDFSRNVLTLTGGTTIAHGITIVFSVILVRFFSPENFGTLALFLSVFDITAVLVTLNFEQTIILPKRNSEARDIISLVVVLALVLCFLLTLIFTLLNSYIADLLNEPNLKVWLLIMPVYLFLYAMYQTAFFWFNRRKKYMGISVAKISQSGATAISKTGFGMLNYAGGLIVGTVIGQLFSTIYFTIKAWSTVKVLTFRYHRLKAVFKKYIRISSSLTLSYEIQRIYSQIPVFYFTKYYDASIVGFYFMAQRIVTIPVALLSRSIGDVFRQEATEQYHQHGKFDAIYRSTLKKTLVLSILPFLVFYIIAPAITALVFGEEWRIAGEYARIMIVGDFMAFNLSPLDKSSLIREKNKYIFYWNLSRLIFNLLAAGLAIYFSFTVKQYLWAFIFVRCFHYLWDAIACYRFSLGK